MRKQESIFYHILEILHEIIILVANLFVFYLLFFKESFTLRGLGLVVFILFMDLKSFLRDWFKRMGNN